MNDRQVLGVAKLPELTRGQDPEQLGGVHGLEVPVPREAVAAVLVRVEQRGEAAVHVEGLVVEALEELS